MIRDAPSDFEDGAAAALGAARGALVTFEAETTLGWRSSVIHAALLSRGIGASVSPSGHTFDDQQWTRPSVVRLSPTYFNTEEEVDDVVAAVRRILATPV